MFNSRRLVTVIACLLTSSIHAQKPTLPADRFAEIFDRGIIKQKTMTSIEAAFTETTTVTLLTRPLVTHGTVIAAAPGRMRMTYTDADRKTLFMDGKTLVVAWADRPERQTINVSEIQKKVNQYFTSASLKDLRSMFQINAAADAARSHVDRIEMLPTEKHVKDGLKLLEIWIDRQTDLMTQMRLSFPSGDSKTIALDQIRVNVPVSDEMFKPPRT